MSENRGAAHLKHTKQSTRLSAVWVSKLSGHIGFRVEGV